MELSAVTGRKGWQLCHIPGFLANMWLRLTLRGCFWSSCWGEQELFEQNFGLLISCFLGIIISGLPASWFVFLKAKEAIGPISEVSSFFLLAALQS